MTCNPNSGGLRTPGQWFNTSCFQVPPASGKTGAPYSFGNEGRDVIEGPGLVTLDVSLVRNFDLGERAKLQFRAESFDAFNHPVFNLPNTSADSSNFGTITQTIAFGTPGRQNQFALRLIF